MLKVTAVGNVTKDLEVQTISGKNGTFSKVVFTVAINHKSEDITEYVDVEVIGSYADTCSEYLHKGSGVVVVGDLRFETYDSEKGKRFKKIIKNAEITFTDKK